ncbi:trna-specific adenosine deaminase [Nannochloropsis oceanica]
MNSTTTMTASLDDADERFMRLALVEAQAAFAAREIPVGAVLVSSEGQVLATGRNRVEATGDASAHAELECLRAASHCTDRLANGHWRMLDSTLYVTLEPCLMCLGAVQSFRVKRIVYGAPNIMLGAIESYIKVLEQAPHPFHACLEL